MIRNFKTVRFYSFNNILSLFRLNKEKCIATSERLKNMYTEVVSPLEESSHFNELYAPKFYDADFDAKPFVLLMGQYSTGKTSFIRHILQQDFPGMRIGPEPTTDKFIAVMHGKNFGVIPGNALVSDHSKPFIPLSKFGNAFLTKFECSILPSPILEGLNIIDTPGILSGEKQRIDRAYDFPGVLEWFATRVDRIILLFDANKLDISDEFKSAIERLKGNEEKVRIVLNKADSLDVSSLMRVYGSLMWSLGKVLKTPEVCRVYIGSFWDKPYVYSDMRKLFEGDEKELLKDLQSLFSDSLMRKINDVSKRARLVQAHALLMQKLRDGMPIMFGKERRKRELIKNLPSLYQEIQDAFSVAPGDFLATDTMKEKLLKFDFSRLDDINEKKIKAVEKKVTPLISELMEELHSMNIGDGGPKDGAFEHLRDDTTPFGSATGEGFAAGAWENIWIVDAGRGSADAIFDRLASVDGKLDRSAARTELLKSGLPSGTLGQVYSLADVDKDGLLDRDEFALAQYIIQLKMQGFDLPATLPPHLVPPKQA